MVSTGLERKAWKPFWRKRFSTPVMAFAVRAMMGTVRA
jgi:hypothetical protein